VSSNDTIAVPPGSGTVQWVATNQNGVTTTVSQAITVLAPTTLFGSQGVGVDDTATVNGTVYVGGGGETLLEPDVTVKQVFSLSPVSVQDRVTAALVDSNAPITFSDRSTDHITTVTSATPVLPAMPGVSMTFTGTTPEIVHPTPQSPFTLSLAPGQYGAVTVYSRGQLILSAGSYAFTSLDLEPQGSIVTPSATTEAVQLFVENTVIYSGSTVNSAGSLAPLYLAYFGTSPLSIGTAFTGTIVSAKAPLVLESLNGQGSFTGEFFAQNITVSPSDTVNSNPFTCK
jgi:hypothetical protein